MKKEKKKGKWITKAISCKLKFIDGARFMTSSLTNLVNNLAEVIHKIKSKYGQDDQKCETCGTKCNYCKYIFESPNFKDDLLEYELLRKLWWKLKEAIF